MSTHLASRSLPLLALAMASLSLLFAAPIQDPVETPVEEPEQEVSVPRPLGQEPDEGWSLPEQWAGLIGTWQLMEFDHAEDIFDSDNIGGYLHLGEGLMTMIIHARNLESDDLPEFLGQAGFHRWRMVRNDILQTATMMGHSNMGESFEWELPNTPREFRVTLVGTTLTLERPDGSRLVFSQVTRFDFPLAAEAAIEDARGQ